MVEGYIDRRCAMGVELEYMLLEHNNWSDEIIMLQLNHWLDNWMSGSFLAS